MNNKEAAQIEYEAVIKWVLNEEDKVEEKLKKNEKYLGGLDTQQEEFSYIYEERNRRIEAIKKKYNI